MNSWTPFKITVFSVNSLDCIVVQSICNISKQSLQLQVTVVQCILVYHDEVFSMSLLLAFLLLTSLECVSISMRPMHLDKQQVKSVCWNLLTVVTFIYWTRHLVRPEKKSNDKCFWAVLLDWNRWISIHFHIIATGGCVFTLAGKFIAVRVYFSFYVYLLRLNRS